MSVEYVKITISNSDGPLDSQVVRILSDGDDYPVSTAVISMLDYFELEAGDTITIESHTP
jgi:hypothetical protein